MFPVKWKSNENYQYKLKRLIDLISNQPINSKVSLIGISAGGSLIINAFLKNPSRIYKLITICSRLKKGEVNGFRGFYKRTKNYPAFRESIENLNLKKIKNRKNILTINSIADELVPVKTAFIKNTKNITIPIIGHTCSIIFSLVFLLPKIKNFLLSYK